MITQLRNLLSIASGRNARSTMFYLGGNVLAAVFPLLLLPVLTRQLTAAEYGVYALALVAAQFLFPLASLGLANAVARDFVDQERLDFPRAVTISLAISSVALFVLVVVVEAAKQLGIDSTFGIDQGLPPIFFPAVYVMVAAQNVMAFALTVLQMNERPISYGFYRVGTQVLFAGLAVIFVVGFQSGAPGVIAAKALSDIFVLGIGIAFLAKDRLLVSRWNSSEARRVLAYGLPLVPHMFSVSLIAVIDRVLLAEIEGVASTGIYMVGFQIGMVMWLITNSTNQAWVPWFFKTMSGAGADALIRARRALLIVGGSYVLIALCLAAVAPIAVRVLSGTEFHSAAPVAALIVIAFLFQGFYALCATVLYYEKRTGLLATASIVSVVVNAVSCYYLIHLFGTAGAAMGTIAGYLASFVMVGVLATRFLTASSQKESA